MLNVASTIAGGLGLGLGNYGGHLAGLGSELAWPFVGYGLAAGAASFIFGIPGVGRYVDQDC